MKIEKAAFDAVIFDLDGVITHSAKLHAKAWKLMFDPYLDEPFDIERDYLLYIDGKPRIEGIRSFLKVRNLDLPAEQLAEEKNALFQKLLEEEGVEVYPSSVALVHALRKKGFKLAIVTSSKNCSAILKRANLEGLFDVHVDGNINLPGKPAPDVFLYAAKRLDVEPQRTVVVEDSLAGVEAGKRGGFGCVIGVKRGNQDLKADWVVSDLSEVSC